MKNFKQAISGLVLFLLLFCQNNASAQYNIQIDANPALNTFCMNLVGLTHYIRLYNGSTNVTTTTPNLHFYIDQWEAFGPQGGLYTFGAGCGPTGTGYELYIPGNSYTTAYYAGPARIYAVNTGGNCILAYKDILIYPDNTWIDSTALTGPSVIYSNGTYTLNTGDLFGNGASLTGSAYINPYIASFYNVNTVGNFITVAPHDDAAISPSLVITCPFAPAGSPCSNNPNAQIRFSRTPFISYSLNNNILCSGSTVLTVNAQDYSGYPGVPSTSPTSNQYIKHFTYQWYNGGSPVSGATSQTYTATGPGTYTCTVTEFGLDTRSTWIWKSDATIAKTTPSVTISAPSSTAPTSNYTINTAAPSGSAPGSNVYNCKPITFANTSTGTINYYKLEIWDHLGGVLYSSGDQYTTPPASVDLRTIMTSGFSVTGYIKVRLTTSTGCPGYAQSVKDGYVNILSGPNIAMTATTTATNMSPSMHYIPYTPSSTSPGSPNAVGRYGTTFTYAGTFGTAANACSYSLSLDKWNGSSWVNVWTNPNVPVTPCGSGMPPVGLAGVGPVSGSTPFFASTTNAPDYSIWRLSTTPSNDCGAASTPLVSVFQVNPFPYLRQAHNVTITGGENPVSFTPVPFSAELGVTLSIYEPAIVSLQVYSIDGRMTNKVWDNENLDGSSGRKTINTQNWPAGMYFYTLKVNDEVYTGKLVKE